MTLANVLAYLKEAISKDLFEIVSDINRYLTNVAAKAEIEAWILFAAGLAAVLVLGLFSYKLVKPLSALLGGYVGYFIGSEIYHSLLKTKFENCPEWVAYVLGGVFAAGFLVLGFLKFSYMLFALGAFGGYCAVAFYVEDSTLLALGAAFLAGMLMITLIRTSVILVSGFGCGILTVGLLSGLFPKVGAFEPALDNWMSLALAALMFFIFITFQFATNRRRKEYIE